MLTIASFHAHLGISTMCTPYIAEFAGGIEKEQQRQ